jgi:hypothetical protein
MLERPAPVDGDEQIVDVNLDKGTFLLPLRKGFSPADARIHWEIQEDARDIEPKSEKDPYLGLLKKLLPRFPMTMKGTSGQAGYPLRRSQLPHVSDTTGRTKAGSLPYRLYPDPDEFTGLPMGRRKAVEVCDFEYLLVSMC